MKNSNNVNRQVIQDKDPQTENNSKKVYFYKILNLYFQIFSCIVILTSILILKQANTSVFFNIKNFYSEKINAPIFKNFDIKKPMENIKENFFNKFHRKFVLKYQGNKIKENSSILLTVPVSKPLNEGTVTSKFGLRKDPFTLQDKQHSGLDIGANSGEIIHAILPGTVVKAERCGSYGNCVKLDHGNNIESLYAHCDKILVSEGDSVLRGQNLALVGSTGRSTGNHLHLEISVNGVKQNPETFLQNAYV